MSKTDLLVQVEGLKTHFPITRGLLKKQVGAVRAVDGVSFSIKRGQTLALVGESGCGKTTVGRSMMRLLEPTAGKVLVDGKDWLKLDPRELRPLRRKMQMIFQDPMTSLNPRHTVEKIIAEGIISFGVAEKKSEVQERVALALSRVKLNTDALSRYPHEFSGGQRQRIGIARALAVEPEILICDESVSALDVSIQAQVLNLLSDLQQELGVSYLFITHDLSVVRHLADEVAVMYLGQIVEQAPKEALFSAPKHPYTQALLAAVPSIDLDAPLVRAELLGEIPSPARPPAGCRFHPRCPERMPICEQAVPEFIELAADRKVHCHLYDQAAPVAAAPDAAMPAAAPAAADAADGATADATVAPSLPEEETPS